MRRLPARSAAGLQLRLKPRLCAIAFGLCLSFAVTEVVAADVLKLDYEPPQGCPSRAALLQEVNRTLGPVSGDHRPIHARIQLRQEDSLWKLEIRTRSADGSGLRRLEAESCEAVVKAAALVLALTIDPNALARPGPSHESNDARMDLLPDPGLASGFGQTNLRPVPARQAELQRSAPSLQRHQGGLRLELSVAGGPAVVAGVLPDLAYGGQLAFLVHTGLLGLRVFGEVSFEQRVTTSLKPSAGGSYSLWSVGAAPCAWLLRDGPRLGVCAGSVFTEVRGEAFGVTDPAEGSERWFSLILSGHIQQTLIFPWFVYAMGEGRVALGSSRFIIEGLGPVHEPSTLAAAGSVGIGVNFDHGSE